MYEELISTIEKEIERSAAMAEELRTLPALEGITWQQTIDSGRVLFSQPYDLDLFHRNRAVLEAAGWTWNNNLSVSPHCGEIMSWFHKGNLMIMIDVDPEVPGSVCKKQVIGYEQKPVYEVVCLEA